MHRYPSVRAISAIHVNDLCLNTSPATDLYDAIVDDVYLWLVEVVGVRNLDDHFDTADRVASNMLHTLLNCGVV